MCSEDGAGSANTTKYEIYISIIVTESKRRH